MFYRTRMYTLAPNVASTAKAQPEQLGRFARTAMNHFVPRVLLATHWLLSSIG